MSMIYKTGAVGEVYITLASDVLSGEINEAPPKLRRERRLVPLEVKFNSSWRIEHTCVRCSQAVAIWHDYTNDKKSYSAVKNLNSNNYELEILRVFPKLIAGIEIRKVNNAYYLNRLDFNYEYDMQRMSSVAPASYSCEHCNAEYLAILRIDLPLEPEKNMPFGRPGAIYLGQILHVEIEGEKRLCDLLESYKVK